MKKRISISCLLGFIFSCLGVIAVPVMQVLTEGAHSRIPIRQAYPIYIGIVVLEIIALIVSIAGVKAATSKQLKLRGLGVAGIVISAGFMLVIGSVLVIPPTWTY